MRVLHLLLAFLATVSLSAQSFQYPRYLEFIPGPVTPGTGPGTGTGPTVRVPHVGNEADFSFPAAQNFSVDFWFRPRSKATGFPILYKKKTAPDTTRGFAIYYNQTEQSLRVNLGNADTSIILDGPDIEVGKWIHIAVIINRGTGIASLFVNGQIEDAENIDGNLTSPTQLVLMGIGSTSTSYTSGGGSLAELRLWRSSLNPNEIRLLAYEQLNPVTPALGINSIGRLSGRLYQSRASSLVLRLRMTTSSPGAVPDSSAGANTGFMYQGNNGPLSSNTATFRRVNDTTTASYYPPPAPAIPRSTNTNNQGWSDPSSWFGPRPETYINPPIVLVPSGKVLKLTDDLPLALDIVVNSGGTLNDVSTGANQLVLFGGIRNNGTVNLGNTSTFLQGSGTLVFSGSSPIRLRNMEINLDNPTDVVRFDNQVEVINAGTVFLEVGRLETQNNLILKARASAPHFSHLVASGTTGNFAILGNIQMEGYLSNTNPGWRQMGFPLKNASLGSGNITGIPLLTTSYVANPGARNVYYYDAVRQGGSLVQNVQRAKGWTQATSTMTNNRAYTIFIDGASPLWPASTFPTITGTPDFANAGFILGYSLDPVYDTVGKTEGQKSQARGWNIVPNPYPASLSAVSLMTSLGSKLIYKAVHV